MFLRRTDGFEPAHAKNRGPVTPFGKDWGAVGGGGGASEPAAGDCLVRTERRCVEGASALERVWPIGARKMEKER